MENKEENYENLPNPFTELPRNTSIIGEKLRIELGKYFDTFKPSSLQRVLQNYMELSKKLVEVLGTLPQETEYAQDILLKRGWYMTRDIGIGDIKNIKNMTDDQIEEMMQEYAKYCISSTLNRTQQYFPSRFNIINDALKAHTSGLFTLSIPVMLAQADGIAYELLKVSFFIKDKNEPKTKKAREEKIKTNLGEDSFTYLGLLKPLDVLSSIQVNTWDRDRKIEDEPNFGTLNRHGVLHGIDLNYSNEANSLRCIMLLSYLLDLKERFFK